MRYTKHRSDNRLEHYAIEALLGLQRAAQRAGDKPSEEEVLEVVDRANIVWLEMPKLFAIDAWLRTELTERESETLSDYVYGALFLALTDFPQAHHARYVPELYDDDCRLEHELNPEPYIMPTDKALRRVRKAALDPDMNTLIESIRMSIDHTLSFGVYRFLRRTNYERDNEL